MQYQLNASKVKCQGCARAIREGLSQLPGVMGVAVDVPTGSVTVDADASCTRETLISQLAVLGYPVAKDS
jgi:copper chaperone CopZ